MRLLETTMDSRCGQIHDRVFGLMGLMIDGLKYLPEPDNKRDLTETTIAMCRAYIEKDSLDILVLAPHCHPHSELPTWCPDFFRFDLYQPDRRIIPMLTSRNHRLDTRVSYDGSALLTRAARIGIIRSLGSTWRAHGSSKLPAYDSTWSRQLDSLALTKELYDAVEAAAAVQLRNRFMSVHGHSFAQVFHPGYGPARIDHIDEANVRWVCGNRDFFTGAFTLGEHAAKLKHSLLRYGLSAWHLTYWMRDYFDHIWGRLAHRFRQGLRLMCSDDGSTAYIGWAAAGAQLYDEIFFVPGCSRPVVLRTKEGGSY